jgi:hypothetical protein
MVNCCIQETLATVDSGNIATDRATVTVSDGAAETLTYPIVDTGQQQFFGNSSQITTPGEGEMFYGQDAQFDGNQPSYRLRDDGLTVHDNVTGLTWTQSADLDRDSDIDADDKLIPRPRCNRQRGHRSGFQYHRDRE